MKKVFSEIANQKCYPFTLPKLPYSKTSFGTKMSAESFEYHHEKHHNAYISNLNNIIASRSDLQGISLEEIIIKNQNDAAIFNNAAQVWNHTFFWHSITPEGGKKPSGKMLEMIKKYFTSYEKFSEVFKDASMKQFGSGWSWLAVSKDGVLEVLKTSNAETPITQGYQPLIACDVWEHAYYIDHRNRRADYIDIFLQEFLNWEFASQNLSSK